MNSYIAIDISQEMLNISRKNISQWFPEVIFLCHKCDMEKELLSKIIAEYNYESDNIINVIISLGGTIQNHKDRGKIFKNIKKGMTKKELFVSSARIGSNADWDGKLLGGSRSALYKMCDYTRYILGIRREDSEIITKVDSIIDSRVGNIKLGENYSIEVNSQGKNKKVLLFKDEEINIWKYHWSTIPEVLTEIEQSGLQLVHLSKDRESSEVIVICQVANL